MAGDDHAGGGNPLHNLYGFIAFLVLLAILWFAAGGPGRADLRGILLNPPAPLGNGQAYGPTLPGPSGSGDSNYQPESVPAPQSFGTSTSY